MVLDDNLIDNGPEWRAFDYEQLGKRSRTGAPSTFSISDKGLSTVIDWKNKDYSGRNIPERNRAQIERLRRWHKRLRISNSGERSLAYGLSELDRQASTLGITRSIREDASLIYRTAAKRKLIRGRSIESMVAASLYIACRRFSIPRTLDEMAEVSESTKKQIGRNYRFLARELNIKIKPISAIDYVPRFASELNLSVQVQSKAIEILNVVIEEGLNIGKAPTILAATALYMASLFIGERKTQRDAAEIAGVTEVTIRNRYKEFCKLDLPICS